MSALQHLGLERGRDWYTIGYWAWELPSFPDGWELAFKYLSELWTISEFSARALRQHSMALDIHVYGHAVHAPNEPQAERNRYGWSDKQTVFLTMADSMSSFQRKNPFATIAAFKQAFGQNSNMRLVVKTRNIDRNETAKADLLSSIGDSQNIELIDESLSEFDRWVLIQSVDAIVSLHRSEGFGLVLAEAMTLGKAVICTDWSGNMDFTTPETAALVKSTLIACEDEYGVYGDTSSVWAEPDQEDAVRQLRRVAEDSTYRARISGAGQRFIQSEASPSAIGKRMAGRLAALPTDPTKVSLEN